MGDSYRVVNVFNPSLDGIYVQSRSHEGQFVHSNGVYYLSRDNANYWLFTVGKAKGGAELLRSTSARLQPIGLRWISPQKIESQMTITFNRSADMKPIGIPEAKVPDRTSTTRATAVDTTRATAVDTSVSSRSVYKTTLRTSTSNSGSVSEFQDIMSIRGAITPSISSRPIAPSSSAAPRSASSTRPSTSINTPVIDVDRYRSSLGSSRTAGTSAVPVTTTSSHNFEYGTSANTGSVSTREKDLPRSESLSRAGSQSSLRSPSSADKPPAPAPRATGGTNTSKDYDYMYTSTTDSTRSSFKYSSKFDAYEPPIPPVRQLTATVTASSDSRHSSCGESATNNSSHSGLRNPAPADSVDLQTNSYAQRRALAEKARQEELEALTRTLQQYTRQGETNKRAGTDDFWSAQTLEKVAASSAASTYSPGSCSPNRTGNITPPPQYMNDRAASKPIASTGLTPPRYGVSQAAISPAQSISDRCADLLARTKAAAESMDSYLDKQLESTRQSRQALGRVGSFSGRYNPSADEPVSAPSAVRHSVRPESQSSGLSAPPAHMSSAHGASASPAVSPAEHTRSTLYRPARDPIPPPPVPVVVKPDVNKFSACPSSVEKTAATGNTSVGATSNDRAWRYNERVEESGHSVRASTRSPLPLAPSHAGEADLPHRTSKPETHTLLPVPTPIADGARNSVSAHSTTRKSDASVRHSSSTVQPAEEETPLRRLLRQVDQSAPAPTVSAQAVYKESQAGQVSSAHTCSTTNQHVPPAGHPKSPPDNTPRAPLSPPQVPEISKPDVNGSRTTGPTEKVFKTFSSSGEVVLKDSDCKSGEHQQEKSPEVRGSSRSPVPVTSWQSVKATLPHRAINNHKSNESLSQSKLNEATTVISTATEHFAVSKPDVPTSSIVLSTEGEESSRKMGNRGEASKPIQVEANPADATVTLAVPEDDKPLPVSPTGPTQDSPLCETGALAMEAMCEDGAVEEEEGEESSEDSCSSTASDTETESEVENEAFLASAASACPRPSAASPKITFSPKSLASKLLSVERAVKQQTSALASQKVLPMELSKSFLLDKQNVSAYHIEGLDGNKVEVLVPAVHCVAHHKIELSSQVILADNWEQIETLWSQTVLTMDQEITKGQAQLQRQACAQRTFAAERLNLSDKVNQLQAQLQEYREKEHAAHKRAGTLLKKHGDGHVCRDQAEGTTTFPCGTEICAEYAAAFSNFESFARGAETTLQSLVSDRDCIAVLMEKVLVPLYDVAQQHVDDMLSAKRHLLREVFSVLLPADSATSNESVPLQFWYATQQPRAVIEVRQLTDEAVEKMLQGAGSLVLKLHRAMQTAAMRGDIGDECTLSEQLRRLLRLHTVAALSDPRCFLHPAPGVRLLYKDGLHQEILSAGTQKYGRIKEGDLVEVVLPGLYFDSPDSSVLPKMRCYVRRVLL